ncbi:hypothetical protein ACJDU8_02330 [Clostridium sp. WILCCON 0269]|uniref:Uncharacterized protein n=1 Tax=Candidatus Clostridium eludens TaxID=3381663 RepID=A0ABW8SEW9_9CLOT
MRLKVVNIKEEFFNIFDFSTEIMTNEDNDNNRPFLLILSLRYKSKKQSFAIPFRSNIQVNKSTKGLYFPLPRRYTTRPHHAHGLHYIKIFPVLTKYCDKFVMNESDYTAKLMQYIEKNISKIVGQAQEYLKKYEEGFRANYCTNIDRLLDTINNYEVAKYSEQSIQTQEQIAFDKEAKKSS